MTIRYTLNGREVSREEWMKGARGITPGKPPAVYGDLDNWSTENGGKGRWNHQLNAWTTSTQDTIDQGKRKGYRKIG